MVGLRQPTCSILQISEAIHCAKSTQRVLSPIAEFCKNSMVSHKEPLSMHYHCHHCTESFKNPSTLKHHMEQEHHKTGDCESSQECDKCRENIPFSAPSPDKHAKALPPALTIKQHSDFTSCPGLNWLAEFAAIATGPQSPLVQRAGENKSEVTMSSAEYNNCASPQYLQRISPPPQLVDANPFSRPISEPCNAPKEDSDARVTSTSPYPSTVNPGSDNWSHFWPKEAWLCFIRGTRVRLITMDEWRSAEDVGHDERLCATAAQRHNDPSNLATYAPYGIRLIDFREIKETVLATFDSTVSGQPRLYAEFASDHPFFVKNKGWTSVRPSLAASRYGIPCQRIQVGDVCLPPSHPDAVSISPRSASPKTENTNTFDFTAMDSNAVLTLSNMAKQRRAHDDLRSKILSSNNSENIGQPPAKKPRTEPERAKRPMNAFMLFAKRYRLEITQMYPGKDNRAISVILGDKWKSMQKEERQAYVSEAKILADEHKRLHPDCWKRKRTTQGTSKVASCRRL